VTQPESSQDWCGVEARRRHLYCIGLCLISAFRGGSLGYGSSNPVSLVSMLAISNLKEHLLAV
jgi:hypothetical protein